jgi:hypothetical protein
MVRPERDRIGGDSENHVEIDEAWVGRMTRGEGRGVRDQSLVICAVEVRRSKPNLGIGGTVPRRNGRYAGRVRLEVIPDRSARSIMGFIEAAIEPGAQVVTDAWSSYNGLTARGFRHVPVPMHGNSALAEDYLPSSIWCSAISRRGCGVAIMAYRGSTCRRISTSMRSDSAGGSIRSTASGRCSELAVGLRIFGRMAAPAL